MAGRRKRPAPRSKLEKRPERPSGSQMSGRKSELERLKEQNTQLHMEPSSGSLKRFRRAHDQDEETDGESNKLVSRSDYGGNGSKLSAKLSKAGIASAASPPEVRSNRPAAGAAHVDLTLGTSASKKDKRADITLLSSPSEQVGSSREGAAKLRRTSDGANVLQPPVDQETEAGGGEALANGIADLVKSRVRKSRSKASNRKAAASKSVKSPAARAVAPGGTSRDLVPNGSSPEQMHGSSGPPDSRKENVAPADRDIPLGDKNRVEADGGEADTALDGAGGPADEKKSRRKSSRRGLSGRSTVALTKVTQGVNETQTAKAGNSKRACRKAGIAAAAAIAADADKSGTPNGSDVEAPRSATAAHLPDLEDVVKLNSSGFRMDALRAPSGGSAGKRKREASQKVSSGGTERQDAARCSPEHVVTAPDVSSQGGQQSRGGEKTMGPPGEKQRQRDTVGASPPVAISLGDEVAVEATQPTPRSSTPVGGGLLQVEGQSEKQVKRQGRQVIPQHHRQQVNVQHKQHQQQVNHHQGGQGPRGKQPVQEPGNMKASDKILLEQYKKMQAQYAALLEKMKKLRDEKIEGAEAAFDAQKQFMENKIKGSSMLIQALQEECDRVRGLLKESRVEELHLENRKLRELVTSLKLDAALLREHCVANYTATDAAGDRPVEAAAAPASDAGVRTSAGAGADNDGHHAPAAVAAGGQGAGEGDLQLQASELGASEPAHTLGGELVSRNFRDLGLEGAAGPMVLRMLLDLLGLRVVPVVGPDDSMQFSCYHDSTGFSFLLGLCSSDDLEGVSGEESMYYYLNVEGGNIPAEQLQDWMLARDDEDVTMLKKFSEKAEGVKEGDCLLAHLLACISGKAKH